MEFLKFLPAKVPKRTLKDKLQNYCKDEEDEQTGEGVLTRRQAKLLPKDGTDNAESVANIASLKKPEYNVDSTLQHSNDIDFSTQVSPTPPSPTEVMEGVEPVASSPTPGTSQDFDQQTEKEGDVFDRHIFNKETLVAENEDLQAFVIKSYFRKIKNFE